MASNPGILSDWPWKHLGSFKVVSLSNPSNICSWLHGRYTAYTHFYSRKRVKGTLPTFSYSHFCYGGCFTTKYGLVFLVTKMQKATTYLLTRVFNLNKDDQIILSGIILYLVNTAVPGGSHLPIWRTDGVILAILLHAGPVEFLYYWLHRALHHHYLYSRYHSHHHSSIITEPITCKTYYYICHTSIFRAYNILHALFYNNNDTRLDGNCFFGLYCRLFYLC
ncbi:protein cer1-like 1 [Quercus suber]|uniref:Protein cer1-like 1 n=1 Tax=Quercus suber TaxID=58331 RepID=A0AAW0KNT0_QUESU